jgi:hypothetical protein
VIPGSEIRVRVSFLGQGFGVDGASCSCWEATPKSSDLKWSRAKLRVQGILH